MARAKANDANGFSNYIGDISIATIRLYQKNQQLWDFLLFFIFLSTIILRSKDTDAIKKRLSKSPVVLNLNGKYQSDIKKKNKKESAQKTKEGFLL